MQYLIQIDFIQIHLNKNDLNKNDLNKNDLNKNDLNKRSAYIYWQRKRTRNTTDWVQNADMSNVKLITVEDLYK